MRKLLPAVVVLVVSISFLARPGFSAPRPAPTEVELQPFIDRMNQAPVTDVRALASARFYAEVFGGKKVRVYWGVTDDGVGDAANAETLKEIESRRCAPLTGTQLATASKLLKEYPTQLSGMAKAFTVGSEGKGSEAADAFEAWALGMAPTELTCPSEHPDGSYERTRLMRLGLECVKVFAPKRGTLKLEAWIKRAEYCARNNHAVG